MEGDCDCENVILGVFHLERVVKGGGLVSMMKEGMARTGIYLDLAVPLATALRLPRPVRLK